MMNQIQSQRITMGAFVILTTLLGLAIGIGQWVAPTRSVARLQHRFEREYVETSKGLRSQTEVFVENVNASPGQNLVIILEPENCEIHSPNAIIDSVQPTNGKCLVSILAIGSKSQIEVVARIPSSARLAAPPRVLEVKCNDGYSKCLEEHCKNTIEVDEFARLAPKAASAQQTSVFSH